MAIKRKNRAAKSKTTARQTASRDAKPRSNQQWSSNVTRQSNAMDLAPGVFTLRSARAIAQSLKISAESSKRRKSTPFRSAMSMLSFEINRAGKNLSQERRRVLERAKSELRKTFGKPA